jgi:hypothetical protein
VAESLTQHLAEPSPGHRRQRPAASLGQDAGPAQSVLALQHAAGNRAVAGLLSGKMGASPPSETESPPITGRRSAEPPPRLTKSTVAETGGGVAATGTGFKTVHPAKGLKNGSFSWTVQWELDKPSTAGGWIVQGVSTNFDVKNAGGTKVEPSTKGVDTSWWPMWEAWKVNPGQKVTTYAQDGDLDDDTYGMPSMGDHTKGEIKVNGTAEFYEGLTLPPAFKVTNQAPAWVLPMSKTSQTLAGGTGPIDHSIVATWDSTPPSTDDTTKVQPS